MVSTASMYSISSTFKSWLRNRVAWLVFVAFHNLWIFLDSTLKSDITAILYTLLIINQLTICCYVTCLCHTSPFQTITVGKYNSQKKEFMVSKREIQRISLCIMTSNSWYSSVNFKIWPICGTYNVNQSEMCCHVSSWSHGCDLITSEVQTHDLPLNTWYTLIMNKLRCNIQETW